MGVVRVTKNRRIYEETTNFARPLRGGMTDAEQRLWHAIRGKQLQGSRFRRQHSIGPYIADFACVDAKLVVELDGGQHQEQADYDERRTEFLQSHGWQVLRFWNNDVLNNLDGVLSSIVDASTLPPPSRPSPLQGEGVSSTE